MKFPKWFLLLFTAALLFVAGVSSTEARDFRKFRAGQLTVMTQNLYVGGDILLPLSADPDVEGDFEAKAAEVVEQILATDYPQRAMKLAELIRKERPHLVGLQEVYDIRLCLLFRDPDPTDDSENPELQDCLIDRDYLEILLDHLNADAPLYRTVATVENIDIEGLPSSFTLPDGPEIPIFVGLTDRDVIIARNDVETRNPVGAHYGTVFTIPDSPIPGLDSVLRGYTAIDATVGGRDYRFVNTHLEVSGGDSEFGPLFRSVQAAQTAELIEFLHADDNVQVVVGDFNSSPSDEVPADCGTLNDSGGITIFPCPTPYYLMMQATYIDVWNERGGRWSPGYTCCQDTLLDNPVSKLDERIDLIWVRRAPDHYGGPAVRGVRADVIGEEPDDKTAIDQLWPSDHAGVSARMTLRVPR